MIVGGGRECVAAIREFALYRSDYLEKRRAFGQMLSRGLGSWPGPARCGAVQCRFLLNGVKPTAGPRPKDAIVAGPWSVVSPALPSPSLCYALLAMLAVYGQ